MALTIYGSPRSRTMRVLWIAEELGLDYDHVPLGFDDPAMKEPAFLAINPAGAVPAIVDRDLALAESLAITLYLAKKYGSSGAEPLYPGDSGAEAQVWRWTLWAQQHLEPWVQNDALPEALREAIDTHLGTVVGRALGTLDRVLDGREWLVGDRFTVGDLNVAGVLSPSRSRKLALDRVPNVAGWLRRCYARPAALAARRRFQA